jgi:hypothetical protein
LIWAGADTDPGQYFLFDKQTKQMNPLLGVRPLVENQIWQSLDQCLTLRPMAQ